MKKALILCIGFFLFYLHSVGQKPNENIIYIVDSITVIQDPEEGNEITQNDIAEMIVVKNKDSLKLAGFEKYDGAIFLFTKEYSNRPEDIKQIPSSKQMERKNGVWLFHSIPYTGQFIDYYYSGRKQGEGELLNGKINGVRKIFYQNGKILAEKIFKEGIENGLDKEYYVDGTLKQKGEYENGKEKGPWESYFPNGQVKLFSVYQNGELVDSAVKYYSTGIAKEKVFIKNGKVIPDPNLVKIEQLMDRSKASDKDGDKKAAIKYCSKIIELDSMNAGAYFSRGTIKLNNFQFDEAITDLDKALQYEPFMEVAYGNRAFARLRKYQFSDSRVLSKNSDVTILASKDKLFVPANELAKICQDLQKAVSLGNKNKMILEAIENYCGAKEGTH